MSVCKGGVGSSTKPAAGSGIKTTSSSSSSGEGKENASSGHRLHMFSDPSPTKAKGGGGGKSGVGGGGAKEDGKSGDANAFDLMPPPLPRTPGKGKGGPCPSRSSALSPLGRHDPNLQQSSAASDDGSSSGGGGTVGRGRATEKVGGQYTTQDTHRFFFLRICISLWSGVY